MKMLVCCSVVASGAETKMLSFRYLLSIFGDLLLLEAFVLLFRRDVTIATGRRLRWAELCVRGTQRSLWGVEKSPSATSRLGEATKWCFKWFAAKPIPLCSSPFVIRLVGMTTISCWNSWQTVRTSEKKWSVVSAEWNSHQRWLWFWLLSVHIDKCQQWRCRLCLQKLRGIKSTPSIIANNNRRPTCYCWLSRLSRHLADCLTILLFVFFHPLFLLKLLR